MPYVPNITRKQRISWLRQQRSKVKQKQVLLTGKENRYLQSPDYTMYNYLPVGILIYQNHLVVYANEEAARLLKYTPSEMIGIHAEQLTHPDFHERAKGRLQAVQSERAEVPFLECILICQDGSTLDAEVKGKYTVYKGVPSSIVVIRDMTERNVHDQQQLQLIRKLEQSEERYRTLMQLSPDAILVNNDAGIVYANDKAAKLYGMNRGEELIGKNGMDYIHPEDRGSLFQKIQQDIQKEEGSLLDTLELRIVAENGTVRYVESCASLVLYNETASMIVIFRDITHRKVNEQHQLQLIQELEQSEQRYRTLLELSPDPIGVISTRGTVLFANQKAAELYGMAQPEKFIGQKGMTYLHPDDKILLKEVLQRNNKEQSHRTSEIRIVRTDGCIRDVETNVVPILYEGKPAFLSVMRDVTMRKEIEGQLKQFYKEIETKNRQMEEQEKQLKATLRQLSDIKLSLDVSSILVTTDAKGIITYVNDTCCELSQYSKKELEGTHHRIFNSGYHSPSFFQEMWRTIHTGRVWKGEIRNRAKDGAHYWVDCAIVPFLDEQGVPYQYMSIQHDITSKKTSEQQLKQMNERLQTLVQRDGLTGIGNRRFFEEELQKQWGQAMREGQPLSVILLDIDYFKKFNDTYGHLVGDDCLKQVAAAIRTTVLRSGDTCARYGGEEFAVLLPNTDTPGARKVAERIRNEIEELGISHIQSEVSTVLTSSLGIATLVPNRSSNPKDLVATADKALYFSKKRGRNCVSDVTNCEQEEKQSPVITMEGSYTSLNSLISEYTSTLQTFDSGTWEHSNRVAHHAIQLAEKLNISVEERQDIYVAGLLHDIGKLSVPFSILNKPTRLTKEEYELIKEHPVLGYERLIPQEAFQKRKNLLDAVLYHHERWDGTGYPHGLKGEDIPLSARILGVVDAFDAMTSDRVYQQGLSITKALEEIIRNRGTQFDPAIADTFCQMFSEEHK